MRKNSVFYLVIGVVVIAWVSFFANRKDISSAAHLSIEIPQSPDTIYLPLLQASYPAWVEETSPTMNHLNAVSVISETEAWAVGDAGTILHYQTGNWEQVSSPVSHNLTDIMMINENDGWIAGDAYDEDGVVHYLLLHYSQSHWEKELIPCAASGEWAPGFCYLHSIDFFGDSGWAVGTPYKGVDGYNKFGTLQFQNGGWRKPNQPCSGFVCTMDHKSVSMIDASNAWVVESDFYDYHYGTLKCGLMYSMNDQFVRIPFESCPLGFMPEFIGYKAVEMIDSDNVWVMSDHGFIHYHDGDWRFSGIAFSRGGMDFTGLDNGWAVGISYPASLILHWNGVNWEQTVSTKSLYDVDFITPGAGWAVGAGGTIFHYYTP